MSDIEARKKALDLNKSVLVQAPAGSGKTTLLVSRYLKILGYAVTTPEECLAVSFTKKAAEEIKHRVISILKLCKLGEQNNQINPEIYKLGCRVLQQDQKYGWGLLSNPNRLNLSTLDALNVKIASKNTNHSFSFGSITENPKLIYKKAILNTLNQSIPSLNHAAKICLQAVNNNLNSLIDMISEVLSYREQWLDIIIAMKQDLNVNDILNSNLDKEKNRIIADVNKSLPFHIKENNSLWQYIVDNGYNPNILDIVTKEEPSLLAYKSLANFFLTSKGELRKTLTKNQGIPASGSFVEKEHKNIAKQFKLEALDILDKLKQEPELIDSLFQIIKLPSGTYDKKHWEIIKALVTLLPYVVANLRILFQETMQIDYSELSIVALDTLGALSNPSETSFYFDCKIKHLLVDEFQDTSLTQFKIIESLISDWHHGDGRSIFLVGDMQQSIYSFRQADVGLFLYVKRYGIQNIHPESITLQRNFRSESNLVLTLNEIMPSIFPEQSNMNLAAISYTRAIPTNENKDSGICWVINDDTSNKNEAIIVAKIIKDIIENKPNENIAILVKSRRHLLSIMPYLKKHGYSYESIDLFKLSDFQVVQDIVTIFKAFTNLSSKNAWIALLRTPMIGLEMYDIWLLCNHNENKTLYENILDYENVNLSSDANFRLSSLLPACLDTIKKVGKFSDIETFYEFWKLMQGDKLCEDSFDKIALENFWDKLFSKSDSLHDMKNSYDELENLLNTSFLNLGDSSSRIKILTIHRAKGLEFDNVILPGLGEKNSVDTKPILLWQKMHTNNDHYLLVASLLKNNINDQDGVYDYLWYCHKSKLDNELIRLLYVALTRAKTRVYGIASYKKSPQINSMIYKLLGSIQNFEQLYLNNLEDINFSETKNICINLESFYAEKTYCSTLPKIKRIASSHINPINSNSYDKKSVSLNILYNYWHSILIKIIWDTIFIEKQGFNKKLLEKKIDSYFIPKEHVEFSLNIIKTAIYNYDIYIKYMSNLNRVKISNMKITLNAEDKTGKDIIANIYSSEEKLILHAMISEIEVDESVKEKYIQFVQEYLRLEVSKVKGDYKEFCIELYFLIQNEWALKTIFQTPC